MYIFTYLLAEYGVMEILYLFAEHDINEILQWITTIICIGFIPWLVTVERRLSTLIAQGSNGSKQIIQNLREEVKNLREELKSIRETNDRRLYLLEIAKARYEGGQAANGSDIQI